MDPALVASAAASRHQSREPTPISRQQTPITNLRHDINELRHQIQMMRRFGLAGLSLTGLYGLYKLGSFAKNLFVNKFSKPYRFDSYYQQPTPTPEPTFEPTPKQKDKKKNEFKVYDNRHR